MKPSDRSLDIAVIGLGQGGGNLAAEFARRGYRAMALNTARSDLSALSTLGTTNQPGLSEAQRLYIGIDGYDGAGADLNYGRQCVTESADRIREAVARHTEGADVVVLTAGLGGGTGSAVSELVRVLESLELPLTTLTTLPADQESGIAKVNAVRAVSDLVKIPDLGLIFADNARLAELHGNVTLDEYFERINEIIIDPLDAFNRLNHREGLHPIRTLDGEDLRTLLMSTGVLNYSQGQLPGLTVDGVTDWVNAALQSSGVMPAGFAMSDIAYLGLVVEASGDLLASTPFTFFNEVSERLKSGTSGAGIYMGVYRNDQMSVHAATLRLLASTPTLPKGIQSVVNAAQREGSALREKLNRSVASLDLGDLADLDLLPQRASSSQPSASNGRGRRSRPNRRVQASNVRTQLESPLNVAAPSAPASTRVSRVQSAPHSHAPAHIPSNAPVHDVQRHSAPEALRHSAPEALRHSAPEALRQSAPEALRHSAPEALRHSPEAQRGSSDVHLHRSSVQPSAGFAPSRPPVMVAAPPPAPELDSSPDPTAELGDRSEPETYDRLVDAFLNTESESIRRRIATRLHSSRNSDHPLARFYANRAIERLVDAGAEEALETVMSTIGAQ
jgi:cell division protein FtsZ